MKLATDNPVPAVLLREARLQWGRRFARSFQPIMLATFVGLGSFVGCSQDHATSSGVSSGRSGGSSSGGSSSTSSSGGSSGVTTSGGPITSRPQGVGCVLSGAASGYMQQGSGPGQPFFPSGYPALDNFYQNEGLALVNAYGVSPRGFFFHDDTGANALASPDVVNPAGPDGTILFGLTLLQQELARDQNRGLVVRAIMAHEFTHLLQFRAGSRTPSMLNELQADYVAGWYVHGRGGVDQQEFGAIVSSFFAHGDYNFNISQHHGTPAQRAAAVQAGFGSTQLSAKTAFQEGAAFVKTL